MIKSNFLVVFGLLCIIILASILRLYKLGQVPVSLYWDETAFGYNAYSLLKTGADEYGVKFPILLRSFDDYKFPAYAYLSVPFIALFGLTEISVRLPSAVAGILTVLLTYLLVKELFRKKDNRNYKILKLGNLTFNQVVALISSFCLAISPWHIQFSRAGFEANISLFFIVLGSVLFLISLRKNWVALFSFVSFAIAIYSYRGALLFVSLMLTVFIVIYFKRLNKKVLIISGLLFLLLIAPLIIEMTKPGARSRFDQVYIGNQAKDYLWESAENIKNADNALWARVFFNRRIILVRRFIENYISHFGYNYLFKVGDPNPRHHVGGMGMLYLWQIPFLILGLFGIFKTKNKQALLVIFSWLIIAPIAASLSYPSPHALRSLYMIIPLCIVTSFGIVYVLNLLPRFGKYILFLCLAIIISISLYNYLKIYYTDYPKRSAEDWADGYKQMASYVLNDYSNFDQFVISGHYWKPYIYLLFYSKYDPKTYQTLGSTNRFDKYLFGGTGWGQNEIELDKVNIKELVKSKDILLILSEPEYNNLVQTVSFIGEIKSLNNNRKFILAKLKNE